MLREITSLKSIYQHHYFTGVVEWLWTLTIITKVNFIFQNKQGNRNKLKKNSFKILRNCKTLHFEKP